MIVSPSETRYWVALGACALGAALLMWSVQRVKGDRSSALRAIGIALLGMQVFELVHTVVSPDMAFSLHRSLPLHFCGLNAILLGILCFRFHPVIFAFAGFMGMIGGLHSVLTPQLPSGDALPLFVLFYVKHAALVVVPIVMSRSFGWRFRRWDWIKTYLWAVFLSTAVMGFNALLNLVFPHPDGLTANYMYVWEAPKAENPLVVDWPWPFYLTPLHVALLVHLIVINALFRRFLPADHEGRRLKWYE